MNQKIEYCHTSKGVSLAYTKTGTGLPLVKVANWLSHIDYDWDSPVWGPWLKSLSDNFTLFRYDERGCGLSERNVDDMSFEAWVNDLETVVDATGLERFALLGISQGGPIAIAYAQRYPEKVSHLILYGTYVRGTQHQDLPPEKLEEMKTLLQLIKIGWGQNNPAFRQVFTTLFLPEGTPEQIGWFNELQRISTSPENAMRIVSGFDQIDVRNIAASLDVPTLVLHARGDARIPYREGKITAQHIRGAQFITLESNNHILLGTEPAWQQFLDEVHQFVGIENKVQIPKTPPAGESSFKSAQVNIDLESKVVKRTQNLNKAAFQMKHQYQKLQYAYEELTKSQTKLVQTEKMEGLNTLVSGVAHEINNPTNFLQGSTHNLKENLTDLKQFIFELAGEDANPDIIQAFELRFNKIETYLETVNKGGDRIKKIVQDLRTFSRLDEAEIKQVNIVKSIQSTVRFFHNKYEKEVNIIYDFQVDSQIECLAAQLNQVFMCLIINSCEAIQIKRNNTENMTSGVLKVSTTLEENKLCIHFQDNGCGMSEKVQKQMFDPFFTTKEVGKGTGMGLSISHGIIEKHQGEILVDSSPDKGTTITIVLPLFLGKSKK